MEKKLCKKCGEEKTLEFFTKDKRSKYGFGSICLDCNKMRSKKIYEENKENILIKQKKWREENPDRNKEIKKKYRDNNKCKLSEYNKKYMIYWREENKEHIREYTINRWNDKMENDLIFRCRHIIRGIIGKSIIRNGYTKKSRTQEILGCSFEDFKNYIESQFEPWMNWENRGLYNGELNYGWDLDHIIPLASAKTEEEIIRLNHYTNFQPLCSKVNRDIKRDKFL